MVDLKKSSSAVPLSNADATLTKIRDAASESASAGRPFLGLCSLIDPRMTGKMTREELIYTCKMMDGLVVTQQEVTHLESLMPAGTFSKDGTLNYRELFTLMQNYHPDTLSVANSVRGVPSFSSKRFTAGDYSTAASVMRGGGGGGARGQGQGLSSSSPFSFSFGDSLLSPIGLPIRSSLSSPGTTGGRHLDTTDYDHRGGSGLPPRYLYDQQISIICERVRHAIVDKTNTWRSPFSLRKQFEVFDQDLRGRVSVHTFQSTLEDLHVPLHPSDLLALRLVFGSEGDDHHSHRGASAYDREDDEINYDKFCVVCFDERDTPRITAAPAATRTKAGTSLLPPSRRLTQRLQELRRDGKDPLDIFEAYDLDNTGMVRQSHTRTYSPTYLPTYLHLY